MSSPPQITTRLTKLLGIKAPIISAPMAFAASPALAAAVTSAGGFGLIGAGFDTSAVLATNLQTIRSSLNLDATESIPIGVGVIGWILDITESSPGPRLPGLLAAKPQALWFAFGDDLGKYIAQVHAHDATREHKTVIFCIVSSVEAALVATNEWKVDVLVAQGTEAGGHGSKTAPPTSVLVQAIIHALPKEGGPLVVAAGGVSTGAQVASFLTLGADGVVLGTRFLFTEECVCTQQAKDILVNAGLDDTRRSMAFDEVGRTTKWPADVDGRAIANGIFTDAEEGLPLEARLQRFDESKAKGDTERLIIWAGAGSGLTNDIRPAFDVLREVHTDAYNALKAAASLIAV